jgi:hypothetical protein
MGAIERFGLQLRTVYSYKRNGDELSAFGPNGTTKKITPLHFEGSAPIFLRDKPDLEDTYDRFVYNGQAPVMPLRQHRGFRSRR